MFKSGLLLNAEWSHNRLMDLVQEAEALGYDTLWYADERFYRETYTGLAACATVTSKILLGPAVTDPYTRHPAITAAAMASVDELSNGRAVLGYAAGASGFRNLGLKPERSVVALREAIHIIRELLAGKSVTYEGEMISIWDGSMKFETRPDLPIYLAAMGPLNMCLAGEVADGVIIPHCASPAIFKPHMVYIEEGMTRSGRTERPKIIARLDASVSNNREVAMFEAKIRLARFLWASYPNIAYLKTHNLSLPPELERRLWEAGRFPGGHNLEQFRPFADAIPDELIYPIAWAGTPEEIVAQARPLLDAGVDEIMTYLLVPEGETVESVTQLFATEVVDRLR